MIQVCYNRAYIRYGIPYQFSEELARDCECEHRDNPDIKCDGCKGTFSVAYDDYNEVLYNEIKNTKDADVQELIAMMIAGHNALISNDYESIMYKAFVINGYRRKLSVYDCVGHESTAKDIINKNKKLVSKREYSEIYELHREIVDNAYRE